MELVLIYSAVFIAGLIVFERLTRMAASRFQKTKALNYRLKLLESSENNLDVYRNMIRERALEYDSAGFQPIVYLRRIFAQSGLKINVTRIALYGLGTALALWFLFGFIVESPPLQAVFSIIGLVAVAYLTVMRARALRIRKFTTQLPGALDVVNRSLSAGHPLPTALAMVSRELPDPIGTEFGMLSDELTYGTDLDEAMMNMIERVGAEDLKLLAVSMSVQRGTGGNFVEILENLTGVIRDRAILKAKIKAISAEGRITSILMSVFPFFLYLLISTLSPDYFDVVWESDYVAIVLIAGFTIMAIGNYVLYKLVNFDF